MTFLRMLIGWHFLYEGIWKLIQPGGWSSVGYLRMSSWFAAPMFKMIADTPWLLKTVDLMNMWGLTLIGLALIVGVMVRPAAAAGILLLAFYYVAQPPFLAASSEGHFLFIDRNVIEAVALLAVMWVPSYGLGACLAALPRVCFKRSLRKSTDEARDEPVVSAARRELLMSLSSLPVLGAFSYAFFRKHGRVWERENLLAQPDAVTGATVKGFTFADIKDLKKPIDQYGTIGSLKLSRMILGGNLIGGWAHARDLLYTDKLVKAYHEDWRVFRTFKMAEACGINSIVTNPALMRVINDYWRKEGGKIQFISDCGHKEGLIRGAQVSVEQGASAVYTHGGHSDSMAKNGDYKKFAQILEGMRKLGVPVGIGAHNLATIKFCVEHDLVPDFWMKTLHQLNYWSARPNDPQHDNIFCTNPEETVAFMEKLEQPWIAFKILAAGALHPKDAFPFALKSGADFICVGTYDFQLIENVNLLTSILDQPIERKRPWRA
ncbi:MAG TPA: DoxX family membrane protein [Kiritimatiellia bacterium]|nr:DoxX family membrane protein [Kiritimatiellia bacterium]HRU70920.1 DoxX family membrane protein [Kiritimatiellia bacterium]